MEKEPVKKQKLSLEDWANPPKTDHLKNTWEKKDNQETIKKETTETLTEKQAQNEEREGYVIGKDGLYYPRTKK